MNKQNHHNPFIEAFEIFASGYVYAMVRRSEEISKDIKRLHFRSKREFQRARNNALKLIKKQKIKDYIKKAHSVAEIDFITKANENFWQWVEKVRACNHLHLEIIDLTHAVIPLYHCRYCGATICCSCWDSEHFGSFNFLRWVNSQALHISVPLLPFKDIFMKPGICYMCRRDEELAGQHYYGKTIVEKYFYRELMQEEALLWRQYEGRDFKTVDEIVEYTKQYAEKISNPLFGVLIETDIDYTLRGILEKALETKFALKKQGLSSSVREILKCFISFVSHHFNKEYHIPELNELIKGRLIDLKTLPMTTYLEWFAESKNLYIDLNLFNEPEKIINMPVLMKIAALLYFLRESPYIDENEIKKTAIANVRKNIEAYLCNEDVLFQRLKNALKERDIVLSVKTLCKLWSKYRDFLIKNKDFLALIIENYEMQWIVSEYECHLSGKYSSFNFEKDIELLKWLKSFINSDLERLLSQGKIYTNVVGMRHSVEWESYMKLDDFLWGRGVKLLREPENQFDPNAIKVELDGFGKLGYIKRSFASHLAQLMDNGRRIDAEIFKRYYPKYEMDETLFLRLKAH